MEIEYEATYENVNKDEIRARLQTADAELVRPEYMQRRTTFDLPAGHEIKNGWLRVRDEGDKITMSLKDSGTGESIAEQKEIELQVDSYDNAVQLLETLGYTKKAYQETKRELWTLHGADITLDEWPFLEPYVEVEAESEEIVKQVSEELGFDYSKALFDSVDAQYAAKYAITKEAVNQRTPEILFAMENPFINRND